ncbi:MAG: hypothetical protein SGI88_13085 [Candidatus Hydrogenedentes bacterium]|nr:hypothetical protein [Candidatus Hydrogenedentota bacterium]
MKIPTREEQRELVRLMEETYQLLDDMRRESLRNKPYDWEEVDALPALGDTYDGPPRLTSGLVEFHEVLMRGRELHPPKSPFKGGLEEG